MWALMLAAGHHGVAGDEGGWPGGALLQRRIRGSGWVGDVIDLRTLLDLARQDGTIPFGQMPQYTDEDGSMVQMNAILRHLARKHGAYGETEADHMRVDMLLDAIEELRGVYSSAVYEKRLEGDTVKDMHAQILDTTARKGGMLVFLAKCQERWGGDYLVGAKPTVADYGLFDLVSNILRVIPAALDTLPGLKAWFERMSARPNIKAYEASGAPHRDRINGNGLG